MHNPAQWPDNTFTAARESAGTPKPINSSTGWEPKSYDQLSGRNLRAWHTSLINEVAFDFSGHLHPDNKTAHRVFRNRARAYGSHQPR